MKTSFLLLLAGIITLVVVVYGVVTTAVNTIEQQVNQLEPYGGCDEAYLYPDTEGARICKELSHG